MGELCRGEDAQRRCGLPVPLPQFWENSVAAKMRSIAAVVLATMVPLALAAPSTLKSDVGALLVRSLKDDYGLSGPYFNPNCTSVDDMNSTSDPCGKFCSNITGSEAECIAVGTPGEGGVPYCGWYCRCAAEGVYEPSC